MAVNFPSNPVVGDTFVVGTKIYTWEGTRWVFDFRNIVKGTSQERPTVTKPFVYYNTTNKLYEVYYPEYSRWEIVPSFKIPVENPTSEFGEQIWDVAGTYSWVCPEGVVYVSAVCVGGGGGGIRNSTATLMPGAGGGGLGWENNIPVVPGQSYTVVVGDGGAAGAQNATDGGDSYFVSTSTVAGFGGKGASTSTAIGALGGSYYPTYQGGEGGQGGDTTINGYPSGGGGAGGYSGTGGRGGTSRSSGLTGTGGAGGGGGGGDSAFRAGGAGGVGLFGEGSSGTGGVGSSTGNGSDGGGGSEGFSGSSGSGGRYGGGAGSANNTGFTMLGGVGAVRLIWGTNRAFPSTNTNTL